MFEPKKGKEKKEDLTISYPSMCYVEMGHAFASRVLKVAKSLCASAQS